MHIQISLFLGPILENYLRQKTHGDGSYWYHKRMRASNRTKQPTQKPTKLNEKKLNKCARVVQKMH